MCLCCMWVYIPHFCKDCNDVETEQVFIHYNQKMMKEISLNWQRTLFFWISGEMKTEPVCVCVCVSSLGYSPTISHSHFNSSPIYSYLCLGQKTCSCCIHTVFQTMTSQNNRSWTALRKSLCPDKNSKILLVQLSQRICY